MYDPAHTTYIVRKNSEIQDIFYYTYFGKNVQVDVICII